MARGSSTHPLILCLALLLGGFTSFAGAAYAQSVPPPAVYNAIDSNGVHLISRALYLSSPTASVGQPGAGGLVYQRTYDSSIQDWRDNVTGTINVSGAVYTLTLLGQSETFTLTGGVYVSDQGSGSTLTFDSGANIYTYTTAAGIVALYSKALASEKPTQANEGRVTQMTMPSGERLTFTYTELRAPPLPASPTFLAHRLQSVNNNLGYQLSFQYTSSTADASGLQLVRVAAINNAVEYCSPTANGCTLTQPWLTLQFGYGGGYETVTDALSRVMRYTISSGASPACAGHRAAATI